MRSSQPNTETPFLMTEMIEDETGELIPLLDEGEDRPGDALPEELPILPVRNAVLFPGVIIPITVGRQKSIKLVRKAYKGDRTIGVVAQKNFNVEDPSIKDIYEIGTLARIVKMLVLPDGNTTIIIQGKRRFKIEEVTKTEPYFAAKVSYLNESYPKKVSQELKLTIESVREAAMKIMKLNPEIPREAQVAIENIESNSFLIHFLSSNLSVDMHEKQKLLQLSDILERARLLLSFMLKEVKMLELKQEIQNKVHTDIDQQQRDYFLRQQMKVLQNELGQEGPEKEIEELRAKASNKKWSEATAVHFFKELDKISRMNPQSPEFPVSMNYVNLLLELPWEEYTTDNFDLKRAKKILDDDHYGLDKVKDRVLEYLAVRKLKNDMKGPILCLYGPPGVGKTSLGRSIAKALGRNYVRMSLGGLHDEAEIRGHRKTYIGSMPGKVIQNLNKAKSSNPVFVLDEIDKLDSNFRGDPSSALLEVLDPEQNFAFKDNYLDIDYDLSKVLFIATANSLETIQAPLRDRMEIIDLSGYTIEEKLEIAKKHLIPKQREEHGVSSKDISFDDKAIIKIIESYTRESGVRGLERKIAAVIRYAAKSIAMEDVYDKKISVKSVSKILGSEIFDKELYQENEHAGVVIGLAWTPVGGDILFIESSLSRGKGKLTLSGQLGDVMKESAITALSYLRTQADVLGIAHEIFDQYDLHIHVPAGAVPKDGPSAGITLFTSLASVYTQRKIKPHLAMTGEITLRGQILPVGGIKEKLLAAKRAGIREIILCEKNKKDVNEIPSIYLEGVQIHYVTKVMDVLKHALMTEKVKNAKNWNLTDKKPTVTEAWI